jgi:hypothetical protein
MYCKDSRHFAANCPTMLKEASAQIEINPLTEDNGKGQDESMESGKV